MSRIGLKGQWGRFGSSAGLQVLGITHQVLGTGSWEEALAYLDFPTSQLLPDPVPPVPQNYLHRHEPGREDPDPWKHRDFAEPMKVAFCVDALMPDCQGPISGLHHALVEHLLGMRLIDEPCWTTRPLTDPNHRHYDRVLVTAFCLFALRRFPNCHRTPTVADAYRWLADELASQPGADVRGLCGLALCGATDELRAEPRVRTALRGCDQSLLVWVSENPTPIIERPWSNAYVDKTNTIDYIFLSPETIVAMYFLRRGMDGTGAEYVRVVVEALVRNINGPDSDNALRGLRVQDTREGTVDQLWATRLLVGFVEHLGAQREQDGVTSSGASRAARRLAADWRPRLVGAIALVGVVVAGAAATLFGATLVVTILAGLAATLCGKVLDAVLDSPVSRLLGRSRSDDGSPG